MTLADPKGNWDYAWQLICELANMDPTFYKPHFANTEFRAALSKAADTQSNKAAKAGDRA